MFTCRAPRSRTVSALEARRDELLRELYRLKIAAPTDS
jgi:hypothetical protein